MKKIKPKFKFWLETEDSENVFGGGKYRLLKEIQQTGSLSAAAEKLHISYRKAWGDLKKAEERLGFKLIDKVRGGQGGGQTSLTEKGEAIMISFQKLKEKLDVLVDETFKKEWTK